MCIHYVRLLKGSSSVLCKVDEILTCDIFTNATSNN